MAEFSQLPGTLDITTVAGDDVSIPIVLTGLDLTGYTFTAAAYKVVFAPGSRNGAQDYDTEPETESLTVTVTDADEGELTVSFDGLDVMYNRRRALSMTSGGVTRTVVSGTFTVLVP